jgi:hypothetical protein
MPTRKKCKIGPLVPRGLDNKQVWQTCRLKNPETGNAEMARTQAAEFAGKVFAGEPPNPRQGV